MHTAGFYDRFSWFYPLVDVFLGPGKRELFREVNNEPPGKLLEIGVGNGRHLSSYKSHDIVGIDTSSRMLASARKQQRDDIRLMLMNGEALSFADAVFDYVVLSHVIAVADNPGVLLAEVHRVLKPGGKLFILNHFTPMNWLKYIDKAGLAVGKVFHFRSVFYIDSIPAIQLFTQVKHVDVGRLDYFKLLIYCKQ